VVWGATVRSEGARARRFPLRPNPHAVLPHNRTRARTLGLGPRTLALSLPRTVEGSGSQPAADRGGALRRVELAAAFGPALFLES